MYPELLTRHDLKTFLPPIGGMTVYIVRRIALGSTVSVGTRVVLMCHGSLDHLNTCLTRARN